MLPRAATPDPGPVRKDPRPLAGTLETIHVVALDPGELDEPPEADELPEATVTDVDEVMSTITSLVDARPTR